MKDLNPGVAWLSHTRLDFLKGGTQDGAYALSLTFTGKPIPPAEVADFLHGVLALPLPALKIVRFSGVFRASDDFLLLLRAFQRFNFRVSVIVDNTQIATWLDEVDWVIIRTKVPMLLFQPDEIWYDPEGEIWGDIVMPMRPGKSTYMFIERTKGMDETVDFICKSQYHWQLL